MSKKISLVVLAAGNSTRFGLKKQWLRIGSEPLWQKVAKDLAGAYDFESVIVVAPHDEVDLFLHYTFFKVVSGGKERQHSLQNALEHVKTPYVLVSDAARACVSRETIAALIAKDADCVVPYLGVVDTSVLDGRAIDRQKLRLIQTPQLSKTEVLRAALKNAGKIYTDESTLLAAAGASVEYVEGEKDAKKLTFAPDLGSLPCLKPPSKDYFTGTGFDVHTFEDGKPMLLGGVDLGLDYGLKAHSDGDALLHAICDALLAAAALGDIGDFFSDEDAKYKNANSAELARQILGVIKMVGYEIVNLNVIVIAQKPKLKEYKLSIKQNVARLTGLEPALVNVAATTTEKMGFIGQGKGLAVQATAVLKFFNWSASVDFDAGK